MVIRYGIFFIGLMIMSLGIVFTIKANFGVSPWDVLHIGLYKKIGLTIGSWSVIVGIVIITISSIMLKKLPPLGSFLNMIFVGMFIDAFMLVPFLTTPDTLIGKISMLLLGIVFLGWGMGVYISAKLGAGPRDSLMLAFQMKTGFKVQNVRLVMEVGVLIVGWLLGGPVHVGTIIASLTIGHVAGFAMPICENITTKLIVPFSKVKTENNHNSLSL